jgi:hypothetical protein
MRDSTIVYRSFYEAICELPKETQADVYTALFEYALNYTEVELTGLAKTIFTLIKPQLDANMKRYMNGSIPKKQKVSKRQAKDKQTTSETDANHNDNDNVNDNENENEKGIINETDVVEIVKDKLKPVPRKRPSPSPFVPPSLEDWKEYFKAYGMKEDIAVRSFESYKVAEWHDSKGNRILNWKQKVQQVWFKDENKSSDVKPNRYILPLQYRPTGQPK